MFDRSLPVTPGQRVGNFFGGQRALPLEHCVQLLEQLRRLSHRQVFALDVDAIVAAGNRHAQRFANAAEMLIPRSEQSQERLGFGNRYRGFGHSLGQRLPLRAPAARRSRGAGHLTIPNSWRERLAGRSDRATIACAALHLRWFAPLAAGRTAAPQSRHRPARRPACRFHSISAASLAEAVPNEKEIGHRRGEKQRVDDVQHSAKTGQPATRIFHRRVALQQRLGQIADHAGQPHQDAEREPLSRRLRDRLGPHGSRPDPGRTSARRRRAGRQIHRRPPRSSCQGSNTGASLCRPISRPTV